MYHSLLSSIIPPMVKVHTFVVQDQTKPAISIASTQSTLSSCISATVYSMNAATLCLN